MKLLGCIVALVAVGVASSAGIGGVISIITDIVDLSLSIGNVISGGCIYYKDICTYQKAIDKMEKELKPKFKTLDDLDKGNANMYKYMTDILALNNDLSQQTGNLQFLVISITRKLGDSVQTYEKLAREFEARTSNLITTYKKDVEAIKNAAITKTIVLGVLDGAKILYSGLKYTYSRLKAQKKVTTITRFRPEAVKANPQILKMLAITNPKFYTAVRNYQKVQTWWNKPQNKQIRKYMADAGIVIGSLFSLGVSVTVDVIMARKMRDSLKTTHSELLAIKNSIDGHIRTEKTVKADLNTAYVSARKTFYDITKLLESAITLKGIKASSILRISDPKSLKSKQNIVVSEYARVQKELQAIDLNAEIILTIETGIDYGDSLSRIVSTINRQGYGPITNDQILKYIAKSHPELKSYDGKSLSRYRG